jgi:hypothetical protein
VFVLGKPFQARLMILSKAGACPRRPPIRTSPLRLSPCLTHKHESRLERPARDKHSSLLGTFVIYDHNKFHNTSPRRDGKKKLAFMYLRFFDMKMIRLS